MALPDTFQTSFSDYEPSDEFQQFEKRTSRFEWSVQEREMSYNDFMEKDYF